MEFKSLLLYYKIIFLYEIYKQIKNDLYNIDEYDFYRGLKKDNVINWWYLDAKILDINILLFQ